LGLNFICKDFEHTKINNKDHYLAENIREKLLFFLSTDKLWFMVNFSMVKFNN